MTMIDEYAMPASLKRIIKRLSARQGVIGVVIVDPDGFVLDTQMDHLQAEIIAGYVQIIIGKTIDTIRTVKSFREITSITIELHTKELIITPDPNDLFTIVILRDKSLD